MCLTNLLCVVYPCLSIHQGQRLWLFWARFWVHSAIPLQVDSQLEICWWGDFSLPEILIGSCSGEYKPTHILSGYTVDPSIWYALIGFHLHRRVHDHVQGHARSLQAASNWRTKANIPPGYLFFHINDHIEFLFHWYALCTKSSLPILCLHRLVDPIFTMEVRNTPCSYIYRLGCARMVVERLSQHTSKLSRSGIMLACTSRWRLVGNWGGISRYQQPKR